MTTVTTRREAFLFVMGVDKEIAEALGEEPLIANETDARRSALDVDGPGRRRWTSPDGSYTVYLTDEDVLFSPFRYGRDLPVAASARSARPVSDEDGPVPGDRPYRGEEDFSLPADEDVSLPADEDDSFPTAIAEVAEAAEQAASSRRDEREDRPGQMW